MGTAHISLPFRLRGHDGNVTVEYSVNEDPGRWGYPLLGLSYPAEAARGFPVCRASVEYPGEGYAAAMGWVQVIRYGTEIDEEQTVLVDTAPQLSDARVPYFSWGVCPGFFDAPSTPQKGIIWKADAFLVATPDALMSRTVQPVCGFTWGYTTHEGPEPLPLGLADHTTWTAACMVLRPRYPSWHFDPTWADEHYP